MTRLFSRIAVVALSIGAFSPIAGAADAPSNVATKTAIASEKNIEATLSGPTYTLSLTQAEEMALQYSYALQMARQDREVARGRMQSALGQALPQVNSSFNKNLSDTYDSGKPNDRWNKSYTAAITATQPLFKAGKIGAAMRGAKLYAQYADEGIRLSRHEVLHATRLQYYAILYMQDLVAVASEQVDLSKLYLDDINKRVDQDMATKLDVLRGEVELTNEETQFINDQNDLTIARSNLLKLLGLPLSSKLALADDLMFFQQNAASEEAMYRQALNLRPDVISSNLTIQMQTENIRSIRSELFPQISLQGSVEATSNNFSFDNGKWDHDWQTGLVVNWMLFDGMLIRGQIKEQRAELEKLRLRDKDLADSVRLEIRQALLDLQYAQKSIERQAKNVEQATESLRLFVEREKQNVSTHLDVLTARQTLADSKRNHLDAIYKYNVAWANLQLANGAIGTETEKGKASPATSDAPAAPATMEPTAEPTSSRSVPSTESMAAAISSSEACVSDESGSEETSSASASEALISATSKDAVSMSAEVSTPAEPATMKAAGEVMIDHQIDTSSSALSNHITPAASTQAERTPLAPLPREEGARPVHVIPAETTSAPMPVIPAELTSNTDATAG